MAAEAGAGRSLRQEPGQQSQGQQSQGQPSQPQQGQLQPGRTQVQPSRIQVQPALSAGAPQPPALSQALRISLEAEIPEALFEGMRAFIEARPDWDQYRLVTSALAGFLFQQGWAAGCVSQHYLNGLFGEDDA